MSDTISDNIGPPDVGAWLSLTDAARFYGVTIRTLDRRRLSKRRLPGRPVEVWVEGADEAAVSDASETPDGQAGHIDERAIVMTERVSDAIGRQVEALVAALERIHARNAELERENGVLSEKLDAVGRVSDAERQRLISELEIARTAIASQEVELEAERAEKTALLARTAPQAVETTSEPLRPLPPMRVRWQWLLVMLAVAAVAASTVIFVPR
jgi:hypothetical protein